MVVNRTLPSQFFHVIVYVLTTIGTGSNTAVYAASPVAATGSGFHPANS